MGRMLSFEQITDSRDCKMEECLPILNDRIQKIKELLKIEGIEVKVGEPYLIDWTETMKEYYLKAVKDSPSMKEYYTKLANEKQIQYRASFKVRKDTRKITWNDVYKLVNSVKAVPYNFI